ncbi:MAG: dihydropteroate synthase [Chloroflexi bacterium]|nr:dihydropteroate synthase [Chloroflexota bacterium]
MMLRGKEWRWGERTYVMGIFNMTPDSFSGDGELRPSAEPRDVLEEALIHALRMVEQGADIIDIGGESTRPGHQPVDAETEAARILPIIRELRTRSDIPISVDTWKADVAQAALDAGADVINDITALTGDEKMADMVAMREAPVVLMHRFVSKAASGDGTRLGGQYRNDEPMTPVQLDRMVDAVCSGLEEHVAYALHSGIPRERIIIDPGIGFGKAREQNLYLVNHLDELQSLKLPILLAASRKAFIGYTLDLPPSERLQGTAAAVCTGILRGADIVRVHDVEQIKRITRMTDALVRW